MKGEVMSAGAIMPTEDFYTSSSAIKEKEAERDKGKTDVSSDAFMQLLVTQMTHQDPLEPMKNEQMMAQLAQLQTLEEQRDMTKQVTSMTEELTAMRAERNSSSDSLLSALNSNSQLMFVSLEAARLGGQISTASGLLGKDVTGITRDAAGTETEFSGVANSVTVEDGLAYLNFPTGERMAVVDISKVE